MIEVHPPEHAPHSVRDFFLHIFTITIGLLIALGLEALVEWRHHVHVGHQAVENIRRELESNRSDLAGVLKAVPGERENLQDLLGFFHQREAAQVTNRHQIRLGITLTTLRDASWETASATGALSYVPFDEVQRFAATYQVQKQYLELQSRALQQTLVLEGLVATEDPNQMPPQDAVTAKMQIRSKLANLGAIQEIGTALDKTYGEALEAK